ncbi:MAG: hypothetical protein E4G94_10060 [ANME-2 cluster archaeon]|nr:MAG: hypothetical protein E4G94_10060 [ANME-2 cluster archaeon]
MKETNIEIDKKKSKHPFFDKLGIICMFFSAIYLFFISVPPLIENLTEKLDETNFVYNLIIFLIGIGVIYSTFAFYRRIIFIEYSINTAFEQVIYPRLEPVLREVAEVQVGLDEMRDYIKMLNLNLDQLRKSQMSIQSADPKISVPNITDYIRIVVLVNISSFTFYFAIQHVGNYIPYILLILYLIWWIEITYEFNLWNFSKAWVWMFPLIIFIPTVSIIMDILIGPAKLIAYMAIGLVIYSFTYYTWCLYRVQQVLPFDLHKRLRELEDKIPKVRVR